VFKRKYSDYFFRSPPR